MTLFILLDNLTSIFSVIYPFWPLILFLGIKPLRNKENAFIYKVFRAVNAVFIGWVIFGLIWLFLFWQDHQPFIFLSEQTNRFLFLSLGAITGIFSVSWHLWHWRIGWIKLAKAKKLDDLKALSPQDFELVISKIFEAYGHKVNLVGGNSDHGIDIIITNKAGEKWVVQCKRYKGSVGEPAIRDLYGTMQHEMANGAYLMTTGTFTRGALTWVADKPIILYDGEKIIELLQKIRLNH